MFSATGLKMRERVGEQEYILFAYLIKLFLTWLCCLGTKHLIDIYTKNNNVCETINRSKHLSLWLTVMLKAGADYAANKYRKNRRDKM